VTAMARVRVVGCGNVESGDDAAGLLAVRQARPGLERIPGVDVVEAGPGLRLIDLMEGAEAVVVVDAVRSAPGARRPGDIVRAEAGPEGLPAALSSSLSSHGFGVAEVVGLAGALGRVPRLVFLGVEALDVTAGHAPSGPVAEALPRLSEMIVSETERLLEDAR
jgi:hydrogenase maturation protease